MTNSLRLLAFIASRPGRALALAWTVAAVAGCGADKSGTRGTGTTGAGGQVSSHAGTGASMQGGSSFGNATAMPSNGNGNAAAGTSASGSAGAQASVPQLNAAGVLKAGCATASVQSELLPANLLFVLDRSGSMNCNPPPTTDSQACESDPKRADPNKPSKWEITRDALNAAMQKLPATASAGISYFSNDDNCGVSSNPSVALAPLDKTQLAALKASLDNVTPNGGTPIVGATILAYKHLHQLALDGKLSGNSFVVLLTDGQESEQCSDPMRCASAQECTDLLVKQEVPKAAGPGADIRTFVIGAPGSEPARTVLSEIALAGGTAPKGCDPMAGQCHFDMTQNSDFAGGLAKALTAITGKAATCELPLPSSDKGQADLSLLNVVYTPGDGSAARVVPQDMRMACDGGAEGWQPSADGTKIELCGAICDTVRADATAHLDVVLGCPVQGPK